METKLRLPSKVSPEDARAVLEKCGFEITSSRVVSIELCDVMAELLWLLQLVQFWGDLLRANGLKTGVCVDNEKLVGVSVHAAEKGQRALVLPLRTPEDALNLPRALRVALESFGSDSGIRADRLSDEDEQQLVNENLDSLGPMLLGLLRVAIGGDPMAPNS